MFSRFAAAAAVGCVVIALASILAGTVLQLDPMRLEGVLKIWCVVPAAWGVWAMLAPASWVPRRLPLWGAILGVIAGLLALFVLNMPLRVANVDVPFTIRIFALLIAAGFYYLLWLLVRGAYRSLAERPPLPRST